MLGDGSQTKPYLYVNDLVAAILLVYDKATEPLAVYHVAGQGMTSVREIAEIVVEEMGLAGIPIDYAGGQDRLGRRRALFQLRQRQNPRTRIPPPLRFHRRGPHGGTENPGQGVGEPCKSSCWPAAVERAWESWPAAVPKPMVRLAGKPILEYQLELARRYGADEAILLTGHLGQVIEEHFGDEAAWGMRMPLPSRGHAAGHRRRAEGNRGLARRRLPRLLRRHDHGPRPGAALAISIAGTKAAGHAGRPSQPPSAGQRPAGRLTPAGRIVAFHPKPRDPATYYRNLANAALYVLCRRLLRAGRRGQPADLGRDVFPGRRSRSGGDRLRPTIRREYIADAGTLERLRRVEADVLSGKVARLNREPSPHGRLPRPRRRAERRDGPRDRRPTNCTCCPARPRPSAASTIPSIWPSS